jgi:hypothetical protein
MKKIEWRRKKATKAPTRTAGLACKHATFGKKVEQGE